MILSRIPGHSKKPELKIKFKKTGKTTTVSVDNMVSVLSLEKVPAKPTTQYAQSVVGFEKLGSGDPWNSIDSLGASLKNRFGFIAPGYSFSRMAHMMAPPPKKYAIWTILYDSYLVLKM